MSLIRDSATYLVVKAVPAGATLAGVLIFVRLVGQEEYGRYALWWSMAATLSALTVGWLNQAQLRFHRRFEGHESEYRMVVQRALRHLLVTLASVAATAAPVFFFVDSGPGPVQVVLIFLAGGGLMRFATRVTSLQAQIRPTSVLRLETARAVLYLALPVSLALLWQREAEAILLGVAGAYILATSAVRSWESGSKAESPAEPEHPSTLPGLRDFWRYGWPLSFWLAITMAFQVTDRAIIQHFLDFEATGQYSSTFDLVARGFSLALFPVTMAVHPHVMKAWNEGRRGDALGLVNRALWIQLALFVPVGLGLYFFGEPVVRVLLPGADVDRGLIMTVAGGAFAWQIALLAHKRLELRNRTGLMLGVVVVAWMGGVLANAMFIEEFGIIAIAYSYLAAGTFYSLACLALSHFTSA